MKLAWSSGFIFKMFLLYKVILLNLFLFKSIQLSSLITELCLLLLVTSFLELILKSRVILFYLIVSIFISILYISVLIYHEYYGAILTFSALEQAGQVKEVTESVLQLFDTKYYLFFADLPFLIYFLIFKGNINSTKPYNINNKQFFLISFVAVCIILINFLSQLDVVNEKKVAQNLGILNYNIFSLIINNDNNISSYEDFEVNQELINDVKEISGQEETNFWGISSGKNVLVIQLEAFQNFPVTKKIGSVEITPNINELLKESVYFNNIYQQIGKGNTSDAEFIMNTSIYPKGNVAMSQEYGDRSIPSLPKILKSYNYTSLTMHTNDIEFWNRKSLYKALGFDEVYDKSYFGEKDTIAFGASDEVLYEKALDRLQKINNQDKKFYANLIAMSSHHPFKIPANKPQLELTKEYQDTLVGDYLQAVFYADYAIGKLVDGLKQRGLWENTLLVIFGDHYGLQLKTEKDINLINKLLGRDYHEKLDAFNIPLMIKIPGYTNGSQINKLGGQIDIMPTIATLLGISLEEQIYFGQDLFHGRENLLGNRFYLPTGSFLNENILFIPGEGFEDGKAFSIETRNEIKDFQNYKTDYEKVLELMRLSDSYVNSLPKRKE